MKLTKVRIQKFRSITDTGWFTVDDLVTGLVGKNESGKTNILQAMYKLNSIDNHEEGFNVDQDYPRKEMTRYKKTTHDSSPAEVISAKFKLNSAEIRKIEENLGKGVIEDNCFTLSKNYKNEISYTIKCNEKNYVKHLAQKLNLITSEACNDDFKPVMNGKVKLDQLITILESKEDKPASYSKALTQLKEIKSSGNINKQIWTILKPQLPKFVYFSDYDIMPGHINISDLQSKLNQNKTNKSEKTFLSLLSMADAKLEDFKDMSFDSLNAQIESASAQLTDEVFQFWTQNKNLKVQIRVHNNIEIYITIWNELHQVSVQFDRRSRGFTWFFSFLAYFNDIEVNEDEKLIVLLDEPGLSLHGKAQYDLLKFVDKRLSNCQVIYSTHSPFMIHPEKFERIRTVEDDEQQGTTVSSNLIKSTQDTGFPLRASLGIDLLQTILLSPNNLLVEGVSELIYIKYLSQIFEEKLNPLWTITPVNGIDKMPAYISLFGSNQLNIAVIVDSSKDNMQKIKKLESYEHNSFLKQGNLIKISDIISSPEGDIEDLFHPEDYLSLVNKSYHSVLRGSPITMRDLKEFSGTRIVKNIECYFSKNNLGEFSHYQVAKILWEKNDFKEFFLENLRDETKQNFSNLISKVNRLISQEIPTSQGPLQLTKNLLNQKEQSENKPTH